MADWIHSLANEWGHWMRRADALDSSIQGVLGKIRDDGLDGAAMRSHWHRIPVTDFPPQIWRFHRAWKSLDPEEQGVIYVDYRMREKQEKRFEIMRKSKSAYYRLRRKALDRIAQELAYAYD